MPGLKRACQSSEEVKAYEQRQKDVAQHNKELVLWQEAKVDNRHADRKLADLLKHEAWAKQWYDYQSVIGGYGIRLFLGDRGNGKTQMAVEMIRLNCRAGKSAMYLRCREIGMKLREAFKDKNPLTEEQAINIFIKPHLLVIDECQERMETDFERRSLTLILDKRYGKLRPTILIANCRASAMLKLLGPSTFDRIGECGGVVKFTWPSLREAIAADRSE